MTLEEKAKAYDGALEQARKELKHCGSLNCDAARQIFRFFPELAESEGDRIRKRICLCLDECVHSDIIRDYERDECLAYLEKQKEQKSAGGSSEKPNSQWKPSEEQMEALMLAIEGKWEAILPTGYMSRRLEDLYEGLANTFGVECNLEK